MICALRVLCSTLNCFLVFFSLVPFDEDDKDDSVWFLDHDYLENMYGMFKKVNGRWHCVRVCVCVGICVPIMSFLNIHFSLFNVKGPFT